MALPRSHLRLVEPASVEPAEVEPALDPRDVEQLFRRYAPFVMRIALRLLGRVGDAEDVVQEVFLDAHRGVGAIRDLGAVRGWLATVAVRKARRRLRKRAVLAALGLEREIDPDALVDARATADERARVAAVYRVLDRVSPEARAAWVLRCVEDEPLEAVAEMLGCSRATAHRRVQEAQRALGEAFDA